MAWVPAGTFRMGSEDFYPEERPVRGVAMNGFWIDRHLVTVAEFRQFASETGYRTVAERPLDPADFPRVDPAKLVPGSLVFHKTAGPVDLNDYFAWWDYVPEACWGRPQGPGSSVDGRARHPVTHVAYEDATAYAAWAGKDLPTEAEWEYAARGGLDGASFTWGTDDADRETHANTWHGEFPWHNSALDGFEGTSPVGSFPPNGYGLHDMAGNVWEWTTDFFAVSATSAPCCAPQSSAVETPSRVIKGGSHLCAPNYCLRYRPAARQAETVDTSTSHIGFRCIVRP
jgi:formylglycine-generating enzyme required for sulfatase activity